MLALPGTEWLSTQELKACTSFTISGRDCVRIAVAQVRPRGWVVSAQELELKHRGIAVPLRDHLGDVVVALSITMPMGHESSNDVAGRTLPVLRETAQAMRDLI